MSSHFEKKEAAEEKTDWRRFLKRGYQPQTEAEHRFVRHAKWRAGLFFMYLLGFAYYNPEYSYTMTYLNTWWAEREKRLAEENQRRIIGSSSAPPK